MAAPESRNSQLEDTSSSAMVKDGIVTFQQKASNGRRLPAANEMKSPAPLLVEVGLLAVASAVVWQTKGRATALIAAGAWIFARILSVFEAEAQPGFGLLANMVFTIIHLAGYVFGTKPIQALQDELDPRMPAHLETVRAQTEKMMGMAPKMEASVEELSVTVRDGSEISVRLTYPANKTKADNLPLAFYVRIRSGWESIAAGSPHQLCSCPADARRRLRGSVASFYGPVCPTGRERHASHCRDSRLSQSTRTQISHGPRRLP